MSVVIVGGHDRMVAQYKKICKSYKCKVKVFTHMGADFNKQIGCPDLLVLFTNTVSHKMVRCALDEIDGKHTDVVRCHTSSGNALSCGVAYTLQIIGQKDMNPTVASLILSLESCISVLAGWILLNQKLSARELSGCVLMFAAIILAQLPSGKKA